MKICLRGAGVEKKELLGRKKEERWGDQYYRGKESGRSLGRKRGGKIGKDAPLVTREPVRTVEVAATKKQLQFYLWKPFHFSIENSQF